MLLTLALLWKVAVAVLPYTIEASPDSPSLPAAARGDAHPHPSTRWALHGQEFMTGAPTKRIARTTSDLLIDSLTPGRPSIDSEPPSAALACAVVNTVCATHPNVSPTATPACAMSQHTGTNSACEHSPDHVGSQGCIKSGLGGVHGVIGYKLCSSGTDDRPSGVEANASHFYRRFDRRLMGRSGVRPPAGVLPAELIRHITARVCVLSFTLSHWPTSCPGNASPSNTECLLYAVATQPWRLVIDAPHPSARNSAVLEDSLPLAEQSRHVEYPSSPGAHRASVSHTLICFTSPPATQVFCQSITPPTVAETMSTSIYDSGTVCWWDVPLLGGVSAVEDAHLYFENTDNKIDTIIQYLAPDGHIEDLTVPLPELQIYPNIGMNDRAVKIFLNTLEYETSKEDGTKGECSIAHLYRIIEVLTEKGFQVTYAAAYAKDRSPSTAYTIATAFAAKFDVPTRLRVLNAAANAYGVAPANKDWDVKVTPNGATGNIQFNSPADVVLLIGAGPITVPERVSGTSYTVRFTPIRFHITPSTFTTVAHPITADRAFDLKAFQKKVDAFISSYNTKYGTTEVAQNHRLSEDSGFWLVDFRSILMANVFCAYPFHADHFARPVYTLNGDPENFLPRGIAQYNEDKQAEYRRRLSMYKQRLREEGKEVDDNTLFPPPTAHELKPYTKKARKATPKRPLQATDAARFERKTASNEQLTKAKIAAAERQLKQVKGHPSKAGAIEKQLEKLRHELDELQLSASGLTTPMAKSPQLHPNSGEGAKNPQQQPVPRDGGPSAGQSSAGGSSDVREFRELPYDRESSKSASADGHNSDDHDLSENEQDASGDITMSAAKKQKVRDTQ